MVLKVRQSEGHESRHSVFETEEDAVLKLGRSWTGDLSKRPDLASYLHVLFIGTNGCWPTGELYQEGELIYSLQFLAVLLDWLIGDPYSWPHPVKWMSSYIYLCMRFGRKGSFAYLFGFFSSG